LFIFLYVCKVE